MASFLLTSRQDSAGIIAHRRECCTNTVQIDRLEHWLAHLGSIDSNWQADYLAGGLNVHNVRTALEIVEPFGVDVCSGVRTDGDLDEPKLAAFCTTLGTL